MLKISRKCGSLCKLKRRGRMRDWPRHPEDLLDWKSVEFKPNLKEHKQMDNNNKQEQGQGEFILCANTIRFYFLDVHLLFFHGLIDFTLMVRFCPSHWVFNGLKTKSNPNRSARLSYLLHTLLRTRHFTNRESSPEVSPSCVRKKSLCWKWILILHFIARTTVETIDKFMTNLMGILLAAVLFIEQDWMCCVYVSWFLSGDCRKCRCCRLHNNKLVV